MNARTTPETQQYTLPYTIGELENGAPVYKFERPGSKLRLSKLAQEHPRAIALAKIEGPGDRTLITDGTAMILVGKRSDSGQFPRDGATGGLVDRTLPNGIPEMTVGSQWLDVGVVERVVVDPGDAFSARPLGSEPQPGVAMFGSAREILEDYKLTAHAVSVGGTSVAGSEIVRA